MGWLEDGAGGCGKSWDGWRMELGDVVRWAGWCMRHRKVPAGYKGGAVALPHH